MIQTPLSLADNDYIWISLNIKTICLKYLNTWKVSLWINFKMLIFSKIPQSTEKLYITFTSILWAPVRIAFDNKPKQCSPTMVLNHRCLQALFPSCELLFYKLSPSITLFSIMALFMQFSRMAPWNTLGSHRRLYDLQLKTTFLKDWILFFWAKRLAEVLSFLHELSTVNFSWNIK